MLCNKDFLMTKVVSDDINALPVHMNKVIKMAATVS